MRDSQFMLKEVVEVIQDIYKRSYLYGPTGTEVDSDLRWLHWFWAKITEREEEKNEVVEALTRPIINKGGTYARAYWQDHPQGTEEECMAFVIDLHKQISERLGII